MSNQIKGKTLRLGGSGSRWTGRPPLPTAQAALFTVAGGRVIVTGLIGEVTTVCDGTATTLKITGNPTTGTTSTGRRRRPSHPRRSAPSSACR
jgi:hypothetical protein